jgi:hypothetical protein
MSQLTTVFEVNRQGIKRDALQRVRAAAFAGVEVHDGSSRYA